MNYLLRTATQSNVVVPADAAPEGERDQGGVANAAPFSGLQQQPPSGGEFGMGDELRGAAEFGSIWTRMPVEDHYDFPPDEGSILIPFRDFPENWASAPDVASLKFLDRDFIFPGEQFHILVHVSARDSSGPEILTPFKAAALSKLSARDDKQPSAQASEADEDVSSEVADGLAAGEALSAESELKSEASKKASSATHRAEASASPTTLLEREGNNKRTLTALDSYRRSHYFVRIIGDDDESHGRKRVVGSYEASSGTERKDSEQQGAYGCVPVHMEAGKFDPHSAGGIAREAVACSLLSNGDIVVLLQVNMVADCTPDNGLLEVLQFQRYERPLSDDSGQSRRGVWDPTRGLLEWLLPLDRPSSPPPSVVGTIHSSPPKAGLTPGNANIFSFGQLRSHSSGSIAALQSHPVATATYAPPMHGAKDWDSAMQERSTRTEVGSEGLLSFRGAVLEPQRFSAHHGLEGPHVPGKRWRRTLSVFQPIKVESYSAHCNAQDLVCVLVENILPNAGKTAEVVIYVDSVNIVCQSAAPGSLPLPVPISCVEVGDDQQLPGLPLRVGEQHSFILRPTTTAWKSSFVNDSRASRMVLGSGHEPQSSDGSILAGKKHIKDATALPAQGHYAVIVSCHCSHTESRLHYKHSLQWRPRPPRDLLVSVSLESSTPSESSSESQPVFKSQVVTVQTTNLTSQDMSLTLLAPSSLVNSPLSMVSFPAPMADSPIPLGFNQRSSSSLNGDNTIGAEQQSNPALQSAQLLGSPSDSTSLPPVQSIESVIGVSPILFRENHMSAADIVADNSPARSHLWLQSTIPLGCVPAHSTTAVKCDILPLVDGIVTLDTLHVSASDHDALYIPESPLQIHTTSSIATGVA